LIISNDPYAESTTPTPHIPARNLKWKTFKQLASTNIFVLLLQKNTKICMCHSQRSARYLQHQSGRYSASRRRKKGLAIVKGNKFAELFSMVLGTQDMEERDDDSDTNDQADKEV
jgi:hypothetical protein